MNGISKVEESIKRALTCWELEKAVKQSGTKPEIEKRQIGQTNCLHFHSEKILIQELNYSNDLKSSIHGVVKVN